MHRKPRRYEQIEVEEFPLAAADDGATELDAKSAHSFTCAHKRLVGAQRCLGCGLTKNELELAR